MRISRTTLSEPKGADRVSEGTLGYFRSRNKHRAYSLVIQEFKRSGLTQADLARRLGKGTDIVCRWLGSPGNWTLDTMSDLLFAISGAEAGYTTKYPLAVSAYMSMSTMSVGNGAVSNISSQTSTDHAARRDEWVVPTIDPGADKDPIKVEVEPYLTRLAA